MDSPARALLSNLREENVPLIYRPPRSVCEGLRADPEQSIEQTNEIEQAGRRQSPIFHLDADRHPEEANMNVDKPDGIPLLLHPVRITAPGQSHLPDPLGPQVAPSDHDTICRESPIVTAQAKFEFLVPSNRCANARRLSGQNKAKI